MLKFKVGDKVTVKIVTSSDWYKRYEGRVATILAIDGDEREPYTLNLPHEEGDKTTGWSEEELRKVSKIRPIKFIAIYEENDVDPVKKFKTKRALIEWLKEAKNDENIDFGSIEVYPTGPRLWVDSKVTILLK